MEELLMKHKQEKKELQANIQKMKQLVPKNDKKRRKEMNQKIEDMELELKKTQQNELDQFNLANNLMNNEIENKSVIEQLEQLKISLENNQMNFDESTSQSNKVSKAQKRRERKEREQLEREQRILEEEKDNENHVRIIEMNKMEKLLKENNLKLHEIASDGDCMYKAIDHQFKLNGLKEYGVDELRKITSDLLKQNKDVYSPFLTSSDKSESMNDEEFEKYCLDIEQTKKWGGNLELRILSDKLKINIYVYQADGPIIKFENDNPIIKRPFLISFHKYLYQLGGHYSSLEKK